MLIQPSWPSCSDGFVSWSLLLERFVLDVLIDMGYGGTGGQARHIGGTGDGGVDGVIDQDKLGLQRIYVQAKRYAADNTVGRESIQGVRRCAPRPQRLSRHLHHHEPLLDRCAGLREHDWDAGRAHRRCPLRGADDHLRRRRAAD